jgi:RimJ/RimL family protein N-acetyltransferase
MKPDIYINIPDAGQRIARAALSNPFRPDYGDQCIHREINGKLAGGVVYYGYTGYSIRMHVASFRPGWLNRDLLWVSFDYPFTQLGCSKIFTEIKDDNEASLSFAQHLGFKEEHHIKDVYSDGGLVVLAMYRNECRWIDIAPRQLKGVGGNG